MIDTRERIKSRSTNKTIVLDPQGRGRRRCERRIRRPSSCSATPCTFLPFLTADERRVEERSELQQALIEAVENTEKIRIETNAILAEREAKSVVESDKLRADCNASLVKKDAECASSIAAGHPRVRG